MYTVGRTFVYRSKKFISANWTSKENMMLTQCIVLELGNPQSPNIARKWLTNSRVSIRSKYSSSFPKTNLCVDPHLVWKYDYLHRLTNKQTNGPNYNTPHPSLSEIIEFVFFLCWQEEQSWQKAQFCINSRISQLCAHWFQSNNG